MKKALLILGLLCATFVFSQERIFENEVVKISNEIERITLYEKEALKQKIKKIKLRVEKGEITNEESNKLKKEAAQLHANNIEYKVAIQESNLQQLVQDKTNGKIVDEDDSTETSFFKIGKKTFGFTLGGRDKEKDQRKNKRTTSQFVVAFGLNNIVDDNSLSTINDSQYKFWKSRFYELGFTLKTRFSKEPSKTYFKYGFSFLWNNLRAKNNQFHVVNGKETSLQTHTVTLSESRLRHVQLTIPMHIEFDFSENKKYEDGFIKDRTHNSIRMGIGGFFGFKLGSRQYLEYVKSDGVKVEEVQKNNFNMNTINYGLSGYLAYEGMGLYVKYDLNSLFKNTNTRNISIGIRFDLN